MILYELVLKYSVNWAKNHPMSPNLITIIGLVGHLLIPSEVYHLFKTKRFLRLVAN